MKMRIALKLLIIAGLVGFLLMFSFPDVDFVYTGF